MNRPENLAAFVAYENPWVRQFERSNCTGFDCRKLAEALGWTMAFAGMTTEEGYSQFRRSCGENLDPATKQRRSRLRAVVEPLLEFARCEDIFAGRMKALFES
jgi:hypothetical protein